MISLESLNPKKHTVDETVMRNLLRLCRATRSLELEYGESLRVTSGYRTSEEQNQLNPRNPKSLHCSGLAVDLEDLEGDLWSFCESNLDLMKSLGFFLESKAYTPKHVHLQLQAPKSGNRIFLP